MVLRKKFPKDEDDDNDDDDQCRRRCCWRSSSDRKRGRKERRGKNSERILWTANTRSSRKGPHDGLPFVFIIFSRRQEWES